MAKSGNFLGAGAYVIYCIENKGLLTEQALLLSKGSWFRQQAFGPSCANALVLCLLLSSGYYKSKLASFTEDPGYRWVCLSRAAQLPSWGLAVSPVSRSRT